LALQYQIPWGFPMYLPSGRIENLLRNETAGVWLDSSSGKLWVVAKLPMNLVREINAGAQISLCAWVVEIDDKKVAAFGLRVYDDAEQPCCIYGPCRDFQEVQDLRNLLSSSSFPLQIHNEIFVPLLRVHCKVHASQDLLSLNMVTAEEYPSRDQVERRRAAMDIIASAMDNNDICGPGIKECCIQPLILEEFTPLTAHFVGSGTVTLEDDNEGGELELLAFQALESLCPLGTFLEPDVRDGDRLRELCDVLAVSRFRELAEEGLFVVQSKVAAAPVGGAKRSTSRRAASIQKNILKAISQLKGAIRLLKAGTPVSRGRGGESIEIDPPMPELREVVEPLNLRERANEVGNGIVLVSDMHHRVDWKEVARKLIELSQATNYCCQVMDLRELQRLVSLSSGRPVKFEYHLLNRWKLMVQEENALVRAIVAD
jgi:hypothetical protein